MCTIQGWAVLVQGQSYTGYTILSLMTVLSVGLSMSPVDITVCTDFTIIIIMLFVDGTFHHLPSVLYLAGLHR